jgi:hypothetical protein
MYSLAARHSADMGIPFAVAVARGVAVVGWQWYQSTEEISAVRMVVVRVWQWQYWPSYASKPLKNGILSILTTFLSYFTPTF